MSEREREQEREMTASQTTITTNAADLKGEHNSMIKCRESTRKNVKILFTFFPSIYQVLELLVSS